VPKVSQEHLDRRRRQIIEAAARCFARKGFHETSLQEIFRESGLSAGAVYRYFKSKDELVQAIGTEFFSRFSGALESVLSKDPVPGVDQVVVGLALVAQDMSSEDGLARLAPLAWAEALHDPTMASGVRQNLDQLRARLIEWLTRLSEDGRLGTDPEVTALVTVLLALLPGFLVVRLLVGDLDATALEVGVAQLLRPELLGSSTSARPTPGASVGVTVESSPGIEQKDF
jgi:TetR/AcrR family transcriptional regulator, transcriptional repressor of aconitase